jgi:DNA invertase Pin-like site-specific DNA recombinase
MTEQEKAIQGVRDAVKHRAEAEQAWKDATRELADFCEAARFSGVPITRIASEAGLSRQAVYDLLSEQPSP